MRFRILTIFPELFDTFLTTSLVGRAIERGLLDVLAATHFGNTTEEFEQTVTALIATARHPTTGRLYSEMVYQPMLELLAYPRSTASRRLSCRAAEWSSFARGPSACTAFPRSR